MKINTQRSFFGVIAAMTSFVIGAMKLSVSKLPRLRPSPAAHPRAEIRPVAAVITPLMDLLLLGTGSNDGYPKEIRW